MQSHFSSFLLDIPNEFLSLKNPPQKLFFTGDKSLLDFTPKVAIIGSRKPNQYAQIQTANLAKSIIRAGGVVVSGGALGVDIIAHSAALPRTIMFSPSSLDTIYPANNANIIRQIATNGLIISEYENNPHPKRYEFLHRNRLVIGISDIVIIPQADRASGSLYSANLAIESKKPLFVLSHRIGESLGTQDLLIKNKAQAIFSIESFLECVGLKSSIAPHANQTKNTESTSNPTSQDASQQNSSQISSPNSSDAILDFCKNNPSFEEAYLRYGEEILSLELEGIISRVNGRVVLL